MHEFNIRTLMYVGWKWKQITIMYVSSLILRVHYGIKCAAQVNTITSDLCHTPTIIFVLSACQFIQTKLKLENWVKITHTPD